VRKRHKNASSAFVCRPVRWLGYFCASVDRVNRKQRPLPDPGAWRSSPDRASRREPLGLLFSARLFAGRLRAEQVRPDQGQLRQHVRNVGGFHVQF